MQLTFPRLLAGGEYETRDYPWHCHVSEGEWWGWARHANMRLTLAESGHPSWPQPGLSFPCIQIPGLRWKGARPPCHYLHLDVRRPIWSLVLEDLQMRLRSRPVDNMICALRACNCMHPQQFRGKGYQGVLEGKNRTLFHKMYLHLSCPYISQDHLWRIFCCIALLYQGEPKKVHWFCCGWFNLHQTRPKLVFVVNLIARNQY